MTLATGTLPQEQTSSLSAAELQQKALATPLDTRYRHIAVRVFATEQERIFAQNQRDNSWLHVRPKSVLVAAMGNHWANGSWHKVCDMLQYCQQQGIYAALSELQDRCFDPYDALGTMRNEAALMAMNEGFEWLLYIDNDVLPEPDTLTRLLAWEMPVVAPYVAEPGTGRRLFGPGWDPNQGLKPAKWCVLSMLLFRVSVLHCFPGGVLWNDAIGADEGFHFQRLWYYGHRPWIDTNVQLITAGAPHYPLASNRLKWAERMALWEKINEARNAPPDRRPLTPDAPHVVEGEYMPFGQPMDAPATSQGQSMAIVQTPGASVTSQAVTSDQTWGWSGQ